jgi:hypothetical protein
LPPSFEWEELVGDLYKRYAVRFPEQGPAWRQLAREEQTHAGALGAIRKMLDAGHRSSTRRSATCGAP